MEKKAYELVAWTVEGGIRMVPSLVKLASEDYLTRIEKIENSAKCGMSEEEEIEWILDLSRAYKQKVPRNAQTCQSPDLQKPSPEAQIQGQRPGEMVLYAHIRGQP